MKTLQIVVITLFAVLALTGAAEATVELWTPPLLVAAGEALDCQLFNTTTRTITANLTIYSFQLGVVSNSGPFSLGPKQFTTIGTPPFAIADQATCDFTVPSRTMVRGSAQTTITNVAVPAQ